MDTPRLSGYPIDQEMIRRSRLERQARRRTRDPRSQRWWFAWLVG